MNKKILASVFVIGMLALAMGYGTYSYFTETETSTGNTFRAGYVDLWLGNNAKGYVNPWAGSLATFTNMAPGQETDATNIWFKNAGPLAGIVTVQLGYTESDETPNEVNVGAAYFASKVIITYVAVDGVSGNVAGWWAQQVTDEKYAGSWDAAVTAGAVVVDSSSPTGHLATVYGVSMITLHFWPSYSVKTDIVFNSGDAHMETLKLKLDASVGNDFQSDGIDITMAATIQNA